MNKMRCRPDQWIEVDNYLKGNLEIIEPISNAKKGKVKYQNNLTDKDIAETVGVSVSSVAYLRQLKYGQLHEPKRGKGSSSERLDNIERYIKDLHNEQNELKRVISETNHQIDKLKQLHDNVAKLASEARATSYGNFDDLKAIVSRIERIEENVKNRIG